MSLQCEKWAFFIFFQMRKQYFIIIYYYYLGVLLQMETLGGGLNSLQVQPALLISYVGQ